MREKGHQGFSNSKFISGTNKLKVEEKTINVMKK